MTAWISLRVVAHPLLDEAGQRREHEGAVDALLVHEREAARRARGRRGSTRIGSPKISRRLLPSGLPLRK